MNKKLLETILFNCKYDDVCNNYLCIYNRTRKKDNFDPNIKAEIIFPMLDLICLDFMEKEIKED